MNLQKYGTPQKKSQNWKKWITERKDLKTKGWFYKETKIADTNTHIVFFLFLKINFKFTTKICKNVVLFWLKISKSCKNDSVFVSKMQKICKNDILFLYLRKIKRPPPPPKKKKKKNVSDISDGQFFQKKKQNIP